MAHATAGEALPVAGTQAACVPSSQQAVTMQQAGPLPLPLVFFIRVCPCPPLQQDFPKSLPEGCRVGFTVVNQASRLRRSFNALQLSVWLQPGARA